MHRTSLPPTARGARRRMDPRRLQRHNGTAHGRTQRTQRGPATGVPPSADGRLVGWRRCRSLGADKAPSTHAHAFPGGSPVAGRRGPGPSRRVPMDAASKFRFGVRLAAGGGPPAARRQTDTVPVATGAPVAQCPSGKAPRGPGPLNVPGGLARPHLPASSVLAPD